jgi:hypothetical protein
MRASDYSPAWRDRLQAISYNPLPQRWIKKLVQHNVIEEADVYHNYRSMGFADKEAKKMTKVVIIDADPTQNGSFLSPMKQQMAKQYATGVADDADVTNALVSVGATRAQADMEVQIIKLSTLNADIEDNIKSIRAGFLSGAFTSDEVKAFLEQLGIGKDRLKQLAFNWQLQLSSRRKIVAAKECSGWYIDGIISEFELIVRLTRLQYNQEDVTRIVQAANLQIARQFTKAEAKAAKELAAAIEKSYREAQQQQARIQAKLKEQQRELEKKLKEQQAIADKKLAQFLSARTDANLKAWWRDGTINENDIRATLKLRGWIDDDIGRWVNHNKPTT